MPKPVILVVDDEPDNFDVLEALLGNENYHLHYASGGSDAIAFLNVVQPDLILLDVMMPDMDGIEVCRQIKAMSQWEAVPIVMVTALSTKQDLAQCLNAGANDFITKPVNRLELIARVRSMLRIWQQHQQLATFNTHLEETVQERTGQLRTLLMQDTLTQLPSRICLVEQLAQTLETKPSFLAVMALDCDQFKLINGSFGHDIGDQLLIAIARRLQEHLNPNDLLARTSGDEFCFLLNSFKDEVELDSFIHEILASFRIPFTVAGCGIFMTVSAGISLNHVANQTPEGLLQDADTAMYQSKLKGKGSYQLFDHQMHVAMRDRLMLETDLQRALDNEEFVTFYQPIINLQTKQLAGFEALARWQHPERGIVSPEVFIPSMETTGLIVPVGLVILKQACTQLQQWHQRGWTELTMSINLSVRQFASPTLLTDIDQVLADIAINPAYLKLEITESAIMDNAEMAIAFTQELRSRQIQISIDDFGTGYSSLGYLHRFPVDNLKIDRSFVNQIKPGNRNYQVVNTIISLSDQLELAVIAEGIETTEQLQWLQQLGCEFGQGYLFSKPLAAPEIERLFLSK